MNALIPAASVLAPLSTLFQAAPDALITWAPVAVAVLLGVAGVGTVSIIAMLVLLAQRRQSPART